jgi:hypothetical protein
MLDSTRLRRMYSYYAFRGFTFSSIIDYELLDEYLKMEPSPLLTTPAKFGMDRLHPLTSFSSKFGIVNHSPQ